jgi:hypothetical protein
MPEGNAFLVFIRRFNDLGLEYMVTGSVAVIVYGEPRLTHDVDLVVELKREKIDDLCRAFPLSDFYCPPPEVLAVEAGRPQRGHFNVIHHETGFKADIYLLGRDALHSWGMSRRRQLKVDGVPVWIAPPEYVILRKLEYYREGHSEKHLRDIQSMMELSGDQIDKPELLERITQNGLTREWADVERFTS